MASVSVPRKIVAQAVTFLCSCFVGSRLESRQDTDYSDGGFYKL
jgi:hypothetical protein